MWSKIKNVAECIMFSIANPNIKKRALTYVSQQKEESKTQAMVVVGIKVRYSNVVLIEASTC